MPTPVKEIQDNMPSGPGPDQAYSSPFNPTTIVGYQVPAFSHVTIEICDVLGREVETLVVGGNTR